MKHEYIFHCPIHGPEASVLCWRAFAKENLHLWKKYEVSYNEVVFEISERDRMIETLQNIASFPSPVSFE